MLLHAKRLLTNWLVKTRPTDLAEVHLRFIAPPLTKTVRLGSTLWNGECDERPIEGRVVGTGLFQRFFRIAKSAPHPALRATFSPRRAEKGDIVHN